MHLSTHDEMLSLLGPADTGDASIAWVSLILRESTLGDNVLVWP
jgi:hypothetical protein